MGPDLVISQLLDPDIFTTPVDFEKNYSQANVHTNMHYREIWLKTNSLTVVDRLESFLSLLSFANERDRKMSGCDIRNVVRKYRLIFVSTGSTKT